MKLRSVRAQGETFDPLFFERDARFWPLARAARRFASSTGWPSPESYSALFDDRQAPVQFVEAPPGRKRRGPIDVDRLYDGRIVKGEVPTRARCWHDYLNALVWATFPRAKATLHRRQHALIRAWIAPGASTLPNARTRAQDALALVDEGGIVLLRADREERAVTFGHALFEGLVHGTRSMVARAVVLELPALPHSDEGVLEATDDALALRLEQPLVPEQLPRAPF